MWRGSRAGRARGFVAQARVLLSTLSAASGQLQCSRACRLRCDPCSAHIHLVCTFCVHCCRSGSTQAHDHVTWCEAGVCLATRLCTEAVHGRAEAAHATPGHALRTVKLRWYSMVSRGRVFMPRRGLRVQRAQQRARILCTTACTTRLRAQRGTSPLRAPVNSSPALKALREVAFLPSIRVRQRTWAREIRATALGPLSLRRASPVLGRKAATDNRNLLRQNDQIALLGALVPTMHKRDQKVHGACLWELAAAFLNVPSSCPLLSCLPSLIRRNTWHPFENDFVAALACNTCNVQPLLFAARSLGAC